MIWNERTGSFFNTVSENRVCAILDHCRCQWISWEACRERGDRAVKLRIEVLE
jgi:hypothetical protein